MTARPDHPACTRNLRLTPGRWRIRVDGTGALHAVTVTDSGRGLVLANGVGDLSFALDDRAPPAVDLAVAPAGGTLSLVRAVVLERVGAR